MVATVLLFSRKQDGWAGPLLWEYQDALRSGAVSPKLCIQKPAPVPRFLVSCGHLRHAKPPWPSRTFGLHGQLYQLPALFTYTTWFLESGEFPQRVPRGSPLHPLLMLSPPCGVFFYHKSPVKTAPSRPNSDAAFSLSCLVG